jgi:hypothetical protein
MPSVVVSGVLTQISTQNDCHSWTQSALAGKRPLLPLSPVALGSMDDRHVDPRPADLVHDDRPTSVATNST